MPKHTVLSRLLFSCSLLLALGTHAATLPPFTITGISNDTVVENSDYTSPAPVTDGTIAGSVTYKLLEISDLPYLASIPLFSSMSALDLFLFFTSDDSALFTVNAIDGIVSLSARDYENPEDSNTDNIYSVTLIATDSASNRNALNWTVTITDQPPVSFSLSGIGNKSVYENTAYTSPTPNISGATIGSVSFSLSGSDATLFAVNSSTGVVELGKQDYEAPADANTDNIYEVTLTGTDADGNSGSISWSVTILNLPPLSFSIAPLADDTDEHIAWSSAAPAVSGSFRSPLQYSLGGSDAALFTLNSDGSVTLPGQNFETPADFNHDNVYEAILTATDNDSNVASTTITVVVHDVPFDPDKDDDGDGVINMVEVAEATDPDDAASFRNHDGDALPDALDSDADNDLLLNIIDSNALDPYADHDGDFVPDYLDADDRGDGLPAQCVNFNADAICDYGYALDPRFDRDQDSHANHADVDSDNDLLPDIMELAIDSDLDGQPDHLDIDSDADGIPDIVESGTYGIDSNLDGIADLFHVAQTGGLDANGDGIDDAAVANDFDADGTPDYLDADSDDDFVPDALEGSSSHDHDLDGIDDTYDIELTGGNDNNHDGIVDNLPAPNTDNEGYPDYQDADSDNDGIPDHVESASYGVDADADAIDDRFDADSSTGNDSNGDGILEDRLPDSDGDSRPNHRDLDSDNDTLTDVREGGGTDADENAIHDLLPAQLTLPLPDSDGDSTPDYLDTDSDNDGTFDIAATGNDLFDTDLNGMVDPTADPDRDGIDDTVDNAPAQYGLVPLDTDSDGIPDNVDNDKDGDSISNLEETSTDSDGDTVPDDLDPDSDNDGLGDYLESGAPAKTGDSNHNGIDDSVDVYITGGADGNGDGIDDQFAPPDTDDDGLADFRDEDSDNDGILDSDEGAIDSDGDGAGNYADIDSDGDFIPDVKEGLVDSDGDSLGDYLDTDSDNDSLADQDESGASNMDADSDGIADRFDVSVTGGTDANGDGIDDDTSARDSDNDLLADYLDIDSDDDQVPDTLEAPASHDTDGDGLPDFIDTDSDNDGIGDLHESLAVSADSNSNGIDDAFDAAISPGTDSNNDGILDDVLPDSDNDGALDLHDLDSDNDTLTDVDESGGTDANRNGLSDLMALTQAPLPDSDGDSLPDYLDTDSNNDGINDIAGTDFAALDGNDDGQVDITTDSDNDGIDDSVDSLPLEFGLLAINPSLDFDNDNIANLEEGAADADGDGIANHVDRDSDSDGIGDLRESGHPTRAGDGNGNGLDDTIDVLVTGGTDADADGVDDAFAPVDSDRDGTPDYLDTDADNDGLADLEETGTVTPSGTDSDADGIDDVFDVDQTGGADADLDGIDDAIVLVIDTDHDGKPNHLDSDSDNDDFPDGIENDDTNNDGIPDRLQAEGEIKGASGSGSTSLPLLLLLAMAARRRLLASGICALLSVLALPAHAEVEDVCRDYRLKPSTEMGFAPCFYAGGGLGISAFDPDADASSWKVADDGDTGFSLYSGYHFARDWFAELAMVDLGAATLKSRHALLTTEETIDYRAIAAYAGYYLPLQELFKADIPVDFFVKAGIAQLAYDASTELVKLDNDSETVPALAVGIEWPFRPHWTLRGEIDSFSAEVSYLNISIAYWFGGETYRYTPAKAAPAEPVAVAVAEEPAPAAEAVTEEIPAAAVVEEAVAAVPPPADTDLDGVIDPIDECPGTPAKTRVDRRGCARYTGFIQSLYGAFNSTDLTYPSYGALDTIILLLKTYPDTRIEIQAHTDDRGTTEFNQKLSEQRAAVVKQYLVDKGIDASRIEAHGYGESKPLGSNETPEGRSKNRRIDFNVLGR